MSDKNDQILEEAKARFRLCADWEDYARTNFRYDRRMDAADDINHFGWPDDLYSIRLNDSKPCLTVNKIHQHVLSVTNGAREDMPGITIRPVGNGATYKASEIIEGICRHIEYISNAESAYSTALKDAVVGGIGYFRIVTDYEADDSFSQEIFIRRIPDALSVYLDPDIIQFDGSDARFGFIYSDVPKDQWEKEHPKFENIGYASPLGEEDQNNTNWWTRDLADKHVRIVEYFRKTEKKDRLHLLPNGQMMHESDAKDAGLLDELKARSTKSREVMKPVIEWYLIAGDEIVDHSIFPGEYVPICRVVGEEVVCEGRMDRHGLVRSMISSQRMYNVMSSAAVEYVGGQTKIPWLVDAASIESFETYWDSANTVNHAYLPYNSWDDQGNRELKVPSRTEPPVYAPAYQQALVQSANDMQAASGIFDTQLGQESNERSGKAINARVHLGNNATAHFVSHLSTAVRFAGKIILGLIPIIYDEPGRILKVLGEDGTATTVVLDPEMQQAHQEAPGMDFESFSPMQAAAILNPSVGKYDVIASAGPSYGTRRMETFNAISQILMQNESLTPVIGDILFRIADFPMADEIADRMKEHFSTQTNPQVQQAQQLIQQQTDELHKAAEEIQKLKSKILVQEQQKEIDMYDSETKRIEAVIKGDPELAKMVLRGMSSDGLGADVEPLMHAQAIGNQVLQKTLQDIHPEGDQSAQGGSPPIMPEPPQPQGQ